MDTYYIVPNKCTECQGFHEEPQCAAVCPVDCCVPDEMYVETVDELMSKKVTYEQMAKLPEKDRTSFNPNIAEGQNYLKVQEYNDLVQKYKSGKISDAERAKAKSLQTELGL